MAKLIALGCPQSAAESSGINWREVGKAYQTFLADPSRSINHIINASQHSRWEKRVMRRLSRQAAAIRDLEVKIDLDELIKLPPDTLGGAYARHMELQGFTPDTFVEPDRDGVFDRRLAVAHDVHHIIAGFDSSPIGEFGLAAFMLVQYRDLLNVFVLSWVPWFAIGYWRSLPQLVAALYRGFMTGWSSKPIVSYPFELHWQTPIQIVRRELGIKS
jgi:ubiquinone biosynthesis protein Coq4